MIDGHEAAIVNYHISKLHAVAAARHMPKDSYNGSAGPVALWERRCLCTQCGQATSVHTVVQGKTWRFDSSLVPPDLNFVILIDVALPSALTDIDTTLIWMGLALRVFVVAFKAIVH